MKNALALGLAALGMVSLAACSGSSKQDIANDTNATVENLGLQGTYTSDCTNILGSVLQLSSYNVKYEITGHIVKTTTYYASNNCQGEVMKVTTTGEYSVPAQAEGLQDTAQININYAHETVTPETQTLVDAMNKFPGGYCKIGNWSLTTQPGIPIDRAVEGDAGNLSCFGTEKLASYFDLITTQNGQLRFGQSTLTNDKSSEAKRPTAIDQTVVAHK